MTDKHEVDVPTTCETESTPSTDPSGITRWRTPGGVLHRTDGPAFIRPGGSEDWFVHGKRHRVGGPAVVRSDGYEVWWLHGKLHRVDGPAITRPKGLPHS